MHVHALPIIPSPRDPTPSDLHTHANTHTNTYIHINEDNSRKKKTLEICWQEVELF